MIVSPVLRVGTVYRYPRPPRPEQRFIDGLPNFFHLTESPGHTAAKLDRGISALARVAGPEGLRRPAILLRTSPNKAGGPDAPWDDEYTERLAEVGYFGDNRIDERTRRPKFDDPRESTGNSALLEALPAHQSAGPDERRRATPLLYFRGVNVAERPKGNVRFEGLAVITGTQHTDDDDPITGLSYPNIRFDLRLLQDGADVDWRWIDLRRDPHTTPSDWEDVVPPAWSRWIEHGLD